MNVSRSEQQRIYHAFTYGFVPSILLWKVDPKRMWGLWCPYVFALNDLSLRMRFFFDTIGRSHIGSIHSRWNQQASRSGHLHRFAQRYMHQSIAVGIVWLGMFLPYRLFYYASITCVFVLLQIQWRSHLKKSPRCWPLLIHRRAPVPFMGTNYTTNMNGVA